MNTKIMKRGVVFILLLTFFVSFASASVYLEQSPNNLYNLKDIIHLTAKITANNESSALVSVILSCPNEDVEVYKQYLDLSKPQTEDITIPLIKEFIGNATGMCVIKSKIGQTVSTISNPFKISDKINVSLTNDSQILEPGKVIVISGKAIRENGKDAEGAITITIGPNDSIKSQGNIVNGSFSVNLPIPTNFEAGEHSISVNAYETNKYGQITNNGQYGTIMEAAQVPTNLEITLKNSTVEPGKNIAGKVTLHDQTGNPIDSLVYVAIKNPENVMVDKIQTQTGKEFSYQIPPQTEPGIWTVSTYSEELISRTSFQVPIEENISMDIINNTLTIKNIGNVPYNKIVPIRIGNDTTNLPINLTLGQVKKYSISAPSGQYNVSVGNIQGEASLTGNAVKIKEINTQQSGTKKIVFWIFLILVLGSSAYFFFKKGYNRTFKGKRTGKKSKKKLELKEIPEPSVISTSKAKGEISLSITGTKQNSPMGCLSIKNFSDVENGQGGVKETMQKITQVVENRKGIIYENKENIFFFLPPVRTKTFKNELPMIELSKEIKQLIDTHNKKFKQKINYGISLNFGTIVTKQEPEKFKFMSMGTLMTVTKKIANKSNKEILMNDKFKERLGREVRYEKTQMADLNVYKFDKIVKETNDNSKFITGFLERQKHEQSK